VNASPANPLLEQFLSEAHDLLESIGKKLLQLEEAPDDQGILNELFRSVHTLKGNSGLFTWPEMTRVLHAGEDLLGMVRSGNASYSRELADRLLEAMDFVDVLCREIKSMECIDAARAAESERMTEGLRKLMPSKAATGNAALSGVTIAAAELPSENVFWENLSLGSVPEAARMAAFRQCREGETLFWIDYRPERECFFHGDDPLNTARHCPGLLWGRVFAPDPLPTLTDLDTYSCVVKFQLLTAASREELAEYYRYLPDQVEISAVAPLLLVIPQGSREVPTAEKHFCAEALRMLEAADFASLRQFVQAMLEGGPAESWLTSAGFSGVSADSGRDYVAGSDQLTPTDLNNRKTDLANHNVRLLEQILAEFRTARGLLLKRVDDLDSSLYARAIPHPRLKTPMRLIDHLYFVAEHDDHHLARIWDLVNTAP